MEYNGTLQLHSCTAQAGRVCTVRLYTSVYIDTRDTPATSHINPQTV